MDEFTLYEQTFSELSDYLLANSIYSPKIVKVYSLDNNMFPLVVLKRPETLINSETLKKTEQKLFISFEIEIYTKDKPTANKIKISNELKTLVKEVMLNKLGMNIIKDNPIPNINENIDRLLLRFSCLLDVDSNIIFRK